MKTKLLLLSVLLFTLNKISGQEVYRMRIDIPVFDLPQNIDLPHKFPSMDQALDWSGDFYELGFFGIDELGNWIFKAEDSGYGKWKKFGNNLFKYAAGLAFSKFGSELPVPLGVWGHEEFHRSVLGVRDISSNNGNWMFDRWDGTVYGISDETLVRMKLTDNNNLLYSYVAGVQYEILLNEKITLGDFYYKRSLPKSALLLYNAYYVWDYFRFSAGSGSDSAKLLSPAHEDSDPFQRDYAGSDLTAWIYDMFTPGQSYSSRDQFPGGDGLNRRIGFSDLTHDEQEYLTDQKKLSLLNFLNPAIFFIERIRLSDDLSFNFFTRYSPTHFGNDIALFLPVKFKEAGLLFNVHRYRNLDMKGLGAGFGVFGIRMSDRLSFDVRVDAWNQPESFLSGEKVTGGYASVRSDYSLGDQLSVYAGLSGKTKGWIIGNPYLDSNLSFQTGISWNLMKK